MKKLIFLIILFSFVSYAQKTVTPSWVKGIAKDSANAVRAEFKVVDDSLAEDITTKLTVVDSSSITLGNWATSKAASISISDGINEESTTITGGNSGKMYLNGLPVLVSTDTTSLSNRINLKASIAQMSDSLNLKLNSADTLGLSNRINAKASLVITDSLAQDIAALPTVAETKGFISDSIATKADIASPTFTGTVTVAGTSPTLIVPTLKLGNDTDTEGQIQLRDGTGGVATLMTDDLSRLVYNGSSISSPTDGVAVALPPLSGTLSTTAEVNTKVDQTDYNVDNAFLITEIARLEALIRTIIIVDTSTTPNPLLDLASTEVPSHSLPSTITLTWTPTNSQGYTQIWRSTNNVDYSKLDSVAYNVSTWSDNNVSTRYNTNPYTYYLIASNSAYKLSNYDSAYNSRVSDFITKNWYVGLTAVSAGNATSWANMDDFPTFSFASIHSGDTLFVDGGADSVVYNLTTTLFITSTGTAIKPIVYTRGIDATHNGVPVFTTSTLAQIFYLNQASYTEVSYLKFKTDATSSRRDNLYLMKCNYVNLIGNQFNFTYGWGVIGQENNFCKILNNTFESYALSEVDAANTYSNPDPIKIMLSYGLEIAYNTFNARSRRVFSETTNSRDIIQLPYNNLAGGSAPTKIHNNFITTDFDTSDCATDIFTLQNGGGSVWVYNNIIVIHKNAGSIFQTFRWNQGIGGENGYVDGIYYPPSPYLSLHAYNNTMILTEGTHTFGQHTYIRAIDSVFFKNNIVNFEEDRFWTFASGIPTPYFDVDYNQYETASTDYISIGGTTYNYTNWKSTFSQDANSDTTGFTLIDNDFTTLSDTASKYMLAAGSSGIDEGTNLTAYFTIDYRDTSRVGLTWDVGAFERVASDTGGGGGGSSYGEELIINGAFTSDIANWTGYASTAKWYNTDWNAVSPPNIPCLLDSATGTVNVRVTQLVGLTPSKTYHLTASYYIPAGNTTGNQIQFYTWGTTTQVIRTETTVGTWTDISVDFSVTENKTSISIRLLKDGDADLITVEDKFYLDNVSLKEVL